MLEFLVAHFGIPLVAGLVLVFMTAASGQEPLGLGSCNDIALDLILLSTGANGAIFLNPRLSQHWSGSTPIVGILVVLVNLLLASALVYRRRWRANVPTRSQAYVDLFLGVLGLGITGFVFYLNAARRRLTMSDLLSFLGVVASAAAVAGILLVVLEASSHRREQTSAREAERDGRMRPAI